MDFILAWSLFVKLGCVAVAGFASVRFLSWLDRRANVDFGAMLGKMTVPQALYFGMRIIAVALVLAALVGCSRVQAAVFPSTYDRQIEAAAKRYLPGVPAKLLKAQYWQESRLDPYARSPAGAEGLAQFMPATWKEVSRAMGYGVLPRSVAREAIEAGAFYMARLRGQWTAERSWRDRHSLALASYNAGLGNILAAQRACHGPADYEPIMACLPLVTGKHAKETLAYAPSIFRWWAAMETAR